MKWKVNTMWTSSRKFPRTVYDDILLRQSKRYCFYCCAANLWWQLESAKYLHIWLCSWLSNQWLSINISWLFTSSFLLESLLFFSATEATLPGLNSWSSLIPFTSFTFQFRPRGSRRRWAFFLMGRWACHGIAGAQPAKTFQSLSLLIRPKRNSEC